ncbi:MAG: trypsin-like peptidase domain-containing protein [Deltaproteobacteria bacterium]|nr:trypsin-like peptidase domain-containing protein [Deltaproteobacteria bacterium]
MFSKAIEKVEKFIRPVVVCKRHYDGTIETCGGTLVVINKDGWFVSTAHVFEVIPLFNKHTREMAELEAKVRQLGLDDSREARRELKRLRPNPKWITASSIWPGADNQEIQDIGVIPEADLLVARLSPFDPAAVAGYPSFKNPAGETLRIGTSLCKIGYAFTEIEAGFDPATKKFDLDFKNLVPFPLDGIYTRNILFKTNGAGGAGTETKIQPKFIETSSPGLKGHSGGPVFDTEGRVWGIQSKTAHIPLGFNPVVEKDGKKVEENQFLNVSWAIHPEVIAAFLKEKGIEFSMTE